MGLLALSYGTFGHPSYGPFEHLADSLRAFCVSLLANDAPRILKFQGSGAVGLECLAVLSVGWL